MEKPLTPREAATVLGINYQTLKEWIHREELGLFDNGPLLRVQFASIDATGANRGDGKDRGSNQPQPPHFCESRNSGSASPTTSTATKTDCHWRPPSRRLRV